MNRWMIAALVAGLAGWACSDAGESSDTGAEEADVAVVSEDTGAQPDTSPLEDGEDPTVGETSDAVVSDTQTLPDDVTPEGDADPVLPEDTADDVTPAPEVVADSGGPEPTPAPAAPDPLPAGLVGQAPPAEASTAPPSLAGVLDTTETPPKDTDLIGHWTVLWFYQAASTSG